jgi:hypothetical protein
MFEEIRNSIVKVSAGVDREMAVRRDFTAAKQFVTQLHADGKLTEATVFAFAKARKYEETVAALAVLSKSSVEVIRPLMQSMREEGVLVPCKVAGLSWEITGAILECRYSTGSMGPHELAKAKAQFAKINLENAQRLLKFWQVRSVPAPTKPN